MAKQQLDKLKLATVDPAAEGEVTEPQSAATLPVVAEAKPPQEPKRPARRQARPASSRGPEAESGETANKGIPVHLPASLDQKRKEYMERTGWSHHRFLLEAIARTYAQLPELIKTAMAGDGEAAAADDKVAQLFDVPAWTAPRTTQEPKIKHIVRVSDTNRQKLDQIADELGAPSRMFLIVTAYKAFLSTNES